MYMIYQQFTDAIKNAYRNRPEAARQLELATASRQWLETLEIDVELRNALVEPIRVLEEAFQDIQ